ncbi:MAG: phosphonate ABC transporter, permease protein PhnE [Tenericutes bacterium]|nr:phosphonate ABC transporter, permease protein PhnE [Mycoplasmatota bacterium]
MKTVIQTYNERPKHTVRNIFISVFLLFLIIWSSPVLSLPDAFSAGINIAKNIAKAFVNPSWDKIFTTNVDGVPFLMFETIGIAVLGTLLGALMSIPFAFLTARNIVGKFNVIGNTLITTIRSFPFFLTALMFIRVSGPGPMTGVLTIGVLSIGMISKLYIEIIEDIDPGILQSLDALGATRYQKTRYGMLPQLYANIISVVIYRFEINVKNATILGIVAAGGIGFTLNTAMNAGRWRDASAALWGIIIAVVLIDYFSTKIRKKLING